MKRISAIGVFSGLLLMAAVGVFMYLTILRPMQSGAGSDGDGTPILPTEIALESWIMFVQLPYGELYAIRPDGGSAQIINASGGGMEGLDWSPDRSRIAFVSNREDPPGYLALNVFVMNVDGSGEARLTYDLSARGRARWSPDGAMLLFEAIPETTSEVWMVSADGSAPPERLAVGSSPVWSPDGQRIAFIESAAGQPTTIQIMDITTRQIIQTISPTFRGGLQLEWSADGSYLFYGAFPFLAGEGGIARIDVQSGAAEMLVTDHVSGFALSLDGALVAYTVWGDLTENVFEKLYVRSITEDGDAVLLLPNLDTDVIAWSPDLTQIAVTTSGEDGGARIVTVVNVDGSGVQHLGDGIVAGWSPYLTPSTDPAPTPIAPATDAPATATPTPSPTPEPATITPTSDPLLVIENQSSSVLCSIYPSITGSSEWDDADMLGADETIPIGGQITLMMPLDQSTDLMLQDCEHNIIAFVKSWHARPDSHHIVIHDPTTWLMIRNESSDLCVINMDRLTQTYVGRSLIPYSDPIRSGTSRSIAVEPGTWNLHAGVCNPQGPWLPGDFGKEITPGENVWIITDEES